jgi:hypothetical protein
MNSALTIFGGLEQSGQARNDTWSLNRIPGPYTWSQVSIGTSTPPSARFGHTAFFEEILINSTLVKRMVVFGGTGGVGQDPTDTNVYELRMTSPTSGTWSIIPQVDLNQGSPAPRFGHTLTHNPKTMSHPQQGSGHASYLVAGQLGSTSFSDEFWILWTFENGTCGWTKRTLSNPPTARARHQAAFDRAQSEDGRLYLFGGESTVPANKTVYYLHPHTGGGWGVWSQMQSAVAGHSWVLDFKHTLSHVIEVYDPTTNAWQHYSSAPFHWDHSYPLNFVVPGGTGANGRIMTVGHGPQTYWLDLPAPSQQPSQGWQTLSGLSTGFQVESAVQYQPGKILAFSGSTGETKKLDATNLAAGWTATSNALEWRFDPNLVLLANGTVLALGGAKVHTQTGLPVQSAQLWDPAAASGAGAWTTPSELAALPKIRAYHSTAILLPDGRVLCSGGEDSSSKYLAEIYCPPYLFKPGTSTLAARPGITEAPAAIRPGQTFKVSVNTPWVTAVSLLRPGATTHGFDHNQRFVPLSFTWAGPNCIHVTAPPSLDHAPVGDYLLFVLGSVDRSDVPSLAKWIRVDAPASDTTPPGAVTDLAVLVPGRNSVSLGWTAPGDDGQTGTAQSFDIRYSTSPINACNFDAANPVTGEPTPGSAGTYYCFAILGLNHCQPYWFALRTLDEAGNVSPLSNVVNTTTDCSGYELAFCDDEGLFAQSGGGGGEEGAIAPGPEAAKANLSPVAETASRVDSRWSTENSIASLDGGDEDLLLLRNANVSEAGSVSVRLFNSGPGSETLRSIGVGWVARDASQCVLARDAAWSGSFETVADVMDDRGVLRSSELAESQVAGLRVAANEVWTVHTGPREDQQLLVLECSLDPESDTIESPVVRVEKADGEGGWTLLDRITLRHGPSIRGVGTEDASEVRLVFEAAARLHSIRRLVDAEPAPIAWLPITQAVQDEAGDVASWLVAESGSTIPLEAGAAIRVDFALDASLPRDSGSFVLLVEGDAALARTEPALLDRVEGTRKIALSLRLDEAVPNPTLDATTITYAVPTAGPVRLMVFDVSGRAIRTLVEGNSVAGEYAVRWDGRRDDGTPVRAGVYFARLEQGLDRTERKLIRLAP